MHLDNVCYDYPLAHDDWTRVLKKNGDYRCRVIKQNLKLIAYCLFYPLYNFETATEDELTSGGGNLFKVESMHIWRIGVLPAFRRKKYGSILVEHVRKEAREEKILQITATISEYAAEENPWLVEFLKSNQLTFDRVEPEQYLAYGRMYDGLIYEGTNTFDLKTGK